MTEKKRRNGKARLIIAIILAIVLIVLLFITCRNDVFEPLLSKLSGLQVEETEPGKTATQYYMDLYGMKFGDETWLKKGGVTNYLLIGIDKNGQLKGNGSYNNDSVADFILLVSVDSINKTITPVEINRDSIARVRTTGVAGGYSYYDMQIGLAYTYGDGAASSCENLVDAVQRFLLGIEIDCYAAITIDGTTALIDSIGPVPVTFDEDYTNVDPAFKQGATLELDGKSTMTFVRSRGSVADDASNLYRIERQSLFLDCLGQHLKNKSFSADQVNGFINAVSKYMVMDLDLQKVLAIASDIGNYTFNETVSPDGFTSYGPDGKIQFSAFEEEVVNIVKEVFHERVV